MYFQYSHGVAMQEVAVIASAYCTSDISVSEVPRIQHAQHAVRVELLSSACVVDWSILNLLCHVLVHVILALLWLDV